VSLPPPSRLSLGFSTLELLLVLALVAILAVAGVGAWSQPSGVAVRSLLDEAEGALGNAHRAAVASGRDVAIVTWGAWDATAPMTLAHGDAFLTDPQITDGAARWLGGQAPDPALGDLGSTVGVPFHARIADAVHSRAQVVPLSSPAWTTAASPTGSGAQNQDLASVTPFASPGSSTGLMTGLVDDDSALLFTGAVNRVLISGSSHRFLVSFVVPIVGQGGAGAPMGLVVVLANGGSVYKFYNPGVLKGDGQWRRL